MKDKTNLEYYIRLVNEHFERMVEAEIKEKIKSRKNKLIKIK